MEAPSRAQATKPIRPRINPPGTHKAERAAPWVILGSLAIWPAPFVPATTALVAAFLPVMFSRRLPRLIMISIASLALAGGSILAAIDGRSRRVIWLACLVLAALMISIELRSAAALVLVSAVAGSRVFSSRQRLSPLKVAALISATQMTLLPLSVLTSMRSHATELQSAPLFVFLPSAQERQS